MPDMAHPDAQHFFDLSLPAQEETPFVGDPAVFKRMMHAIQADDAEAVRAALKDGVPLEGRPMVEPAYGTVPADLHATWLGWATLADKPKAVLALLAAGADAAHRVSADDPTPIVLEAFKMGRWNMVQAYLNACPWVSAVEPKSVLGRGPLANVLDAASHLIPLLPADRVPGSPLDRTVDDRRKLVEALLERLPERELSAGEIDDLWQGAARSLSVAGSKKLEKLGMKLAEAPVTTRQAMLLKVMWMGDANWGSSARMNVWFDALAALDTPMPNSPDVACLANSVQQKYRDKLAARIRAPVRVNGGQPALTELPQAEFGQRPYSQISPTSRRTF